MEFNGHQHTAVRPASAGREIRRASVLFILLLAIKFFFIYERYFPILFFDEAVYIFKARNFAVFFSYFTPPGIRDLLDLYAPLYSLVLSPVFVFFKSPELTYKLILGINALLTSAIVFPLYFLSADFCPKPYRIWITLAAASLASSFGYAFSAMSEALFVTLYCFAVYFYYKKLQTNRKLFQLLFWSSGCLLLLTKNVCIVLIPAYALITLLRVFIGGDKPGRWKMMLWDLGFLAVIAIPRLIWDGILEARGGTDQTAAHYLNHTLACIGDSFSHFMQYAGTWIGQIGYLFLATYTLCLFILAMPSREKRGRGEPRSRGKDLALMIIISTLFLIGAATAHMFMGGMRDGQSRYLMYGRYADMVVPLVFLFSAARVLSLDLKTYLKKHPLRGCLTGFFFLLIPALTVYHLPGRIEGIRVLNMGAAWTDYLMQSLSLQRTALFLLLIIFPAAILLCGKYRPILVLFSVLLLNSLNMGIVYRNVLRHEASGLDFLHQARQVTRHPEATLWIDHKNLDPVFFCRIGYYFHTDTHLLRKISNIRMDRDYIVSGKKILKASDCARALEERQKRKKLKWDARTRQGSD